MLKGVPVWLEEVLFSSYLPARWGVDPLNWKFLGDCCWFICKGYFLGSPESFFNEVAGENFFYMLEQKLLYSFTLAFWWFSWLSCLECTLLINLDISLTEKQFFNTFSLQGDPIAFFSPPSNVNSICAAPSLFSLELNLNLSSFLNTSR